MKSTLIIVAILAAALSSSIFAGAGSEDGGSASKASEAPENSSREAMAAFVKEALDYAQERGKEMALQEFGNKSGEFVRGDLYIYAYDFQGVNLAHPYRPEFRGTSKLNLTDPNGVTPTRNVIDVARRGDGFSYFIFPNPSHDGRDELKLSYVVKVDGTWWLGSGIYLSGVPCFFSPESRQELVSFVEEALNYTREKGKVEALKAFNDRNGRFVREDRYIFAYGFNGTTLALPFQPELIGKDRMDLQDPNGVRILQDLIDQAGRGSGFTYYLYPDPARNMSERLKLSYVVKVDETWWLGSGIYEAGLYETFANASPSKPSAREELEAFVRSAVAFARQAGRERATEAFMDLKGPWVVEEVYVFAQDFNGTALALPYLPREVGTNRLDLQDARGTYINRDMRSIALNGSGFYEYLYRNPLTNQTEPKVSYVMKVDESWWLGAGIYL